MYYKITKRPTLFKRLVGVKIETFDLMVEVVTKSQEKRLQGETRGGPSKLSIED